MRIRKCASRLLGSTYSAAPPLQPAPRFELPPFQLPAREEAPPPPPPPPPPAPPCPGLESGGGVAVFSAPTASGEPCELSRSPWDLLGELDFSDPQDVKLVEKYFVHVACRASWILTTSMPASAATAAAVNEASAKPRPRPRPKVARKRVRKPPPPPPAKKEQVEETEKVGKIEVKTEEEKVEKIEEEKVEKSDLKEMGDDAKKEEEEGSVPVAAGEEAKVWTCKKNDGKRWHCQRPVSRPNALCDYHFEQKRSYYNPAYDSPSEVAAAAPVTVASSAPPLLAVKTSKSSSKQYSRPSRPSTGSKPRRKRVTVDSGEGFYYYTGFGPFRSKRNCRSSSMQQESAPVVEQEEPKDIDAAPSAGKADQCDDDTDHRPVSAPAPVVAPVQVYESTSDDDIAGIAGGDEESSDDGGRVFNGKGGKRSNINGADSKRNNKCQVKKRWRKPVKARSLKSLM